MQNGLNPGPRQSVQTVARNAAPGQKFLSNLAETYARCLVNPFSGPLTGIPTEPVLYSQVDRIFSRGTLVTGTAGVGFVSMSPSSMVANDVGGVEFSTAAYAGNAIDASAAAGTGFVLSNSTFAAADFGPDGAQVQYRIVSAGLRIRYTGQNLTRGGRSIGLHEPSHDTLDGDATAKLLSYDNSGSFVPAETIDWATVLYRPVLDTDWNFKTVVPAFQTTAFMGFLIENPVATSPFSYEFESYVVVEFQGTQLRHKVSSMADATGASAVHSTMVLAAKLRKPHQFPEKELEERAVAAANHYARHNTSHPGPKDKEEEGPSGLEKFFTGAANVVGSLFGAAARVL